MTPNSTLQTLLASESEENSPNNVVKPADEVLQPSSLAGFIWPETDPALVEQTTRARTDSDYEKVRTSATNVRIDWKSFFKEHGKKSLPEQVLELVTNYKFQFNPRTAILQDADWKERIAKFVFYNQPITMVYPLLCKVGNDAKQMNNGGVNAGEEATIIFFSHINDIVKTIYPPGLHFIIATDAQLYNSAFQNTEVEVAAYISECRQLVKERGADRLISICNYVDLLAEFPNEYQTSHTKYRRRFQTDPQSILEGIHSQTLFDSVKATINTRKLHLAYHDQKDIFSGVVNTNNPYFKEVDTLAKIAFEEVICIRMACSELNIFERKFPGAIRLTCHKGLKNGRAVIGLRPYPEYYGSSKLLPYHGVPVISNSSHGLKMDIHPEITLRGRADLVRVVNERGETYFYDATEK